MILLLKKKGTNTTNTNINNNIHTNTNNNTNYHTNINTNTHTNSIMKFWKKVNPNSQKVSSSSLLLLSLLSSLSLGLTFS